MTKDYLDWNDFVPHAPDTPGEQVNIHHCKDGRNNDRLYIRRLDDGHTILAYCHHCGKSGYYRQDKHGGKSLTQVDSSFSQAGKSAGTQGNGTGGGERGRLPRDCTTNWPRPFADWLAECGIGEGRAKSLGILYSDTIQRLIFPFYSDTGELMGWQGRDIRSRPGVPKWYLDEKVKDTVIPLYRRDADERTEILCIVEDIPSAIRLSEFYDTLALLGTHLKQQYYPTVCEYGTYIVWLDHDNPEVIKKELKMIKTLGTLGETLHIVSDQDPKHYSGMELRNFLDAALTDRES